MDWQFDTEGVEAGFELVGILGLNVEKIGWVLVEGKTERGQIRQ